MRVPSVAVVIACAAMPSRVRADVDSETFRPTPSVVASGFQVEPAEVGAAGEWTLGTVMSYAMNPMAVETTLGGAAVASDRPVSRRAMLELGGAYAFLDRFEAGLRAPFYSQSGDSPDTSVFHVPAAHGMAIGDLSVHGRARLFRGERASLAAALHVTLPTSTAGQFVGVDGPTARVLVLGALRPMSILTLTANVGAVLRATSTYRNDPDVMAGAILISQGSGLAWGLGVGLDVTDRLQLTAEVFGERVSSGNTIMGADAPVDVLAGARFHTDGGWTIGLAGGRGMSASLGTPDARAVLELAFASRPAPHRFVGAGRIAATPKHTSEPDADGDGIPDSRDKCPNQAEDLDAFQDEDGCPDLDDDFDGIPDTLDKCPDEPETWNGIADDDGCPDSAATTSPAAQSTQDVATKIFKQGRELMKERKYVEACAAFEHSYRLDPGFGTKANLATCYTEIGKLATAWTMLRELGDSDPNLDRRKLVKEAGERLASRVPKLHLAIDAPPAGFILQLNKSDASALVGIDTPVDFGTFEITSSAPGFKPWQQTVVVKAEGMVTQVKIVLERAR